MVGHSCRFVRLLVSSSTFFAILSLFSLPSCQFFHNFEKSPLARFSFLFCQIFFLELTTAALYSGLVRLKLVASAGRRLERDVYS